MQVYNLTIRQFGALQSIAPNMRESQLRQIVHIVVCMRIAAAHLPLPSLLLHVVS